MFETSFVPDPHFSDALLSETPVIVQDTCRCSRPGVRDTLRSSRPSVPLLVPGQVFQPPLPRSRRNAIDNLSESFVVQDTLVCSRCCGQQDTLFVRHTVFETPLPLLFETRCSRPSSLFETRCSRPSSLFETKKL